jgi:RNA ligase (TIGR02306 family)
MTAIETVLPEELAPIRSGVGVVETERKLARIVVIDEVIKHPNADRLSLALVGGWQCVVKLDEYKAGDRAIYCEIDSLLPVEHPLFSFLEARRSDLRTVNGTNYHRLKTTKFRKELAQGLVVPIPAELSGKKVDDNVTLELGILKYESSGKKNAESLKAPDWYERLVARVMGDLQNEKPWPKFLTKSTEDRVQNLTMAYRKAVENNELFEASIKLNGASMTVYNVVQDAMMLSGVCSRNVEYDLEPVPWTRFEQLRYWVASFLGRNRRCIARRRLIWPAWKVSKNDSNDFTNYVKAHGLVEKLQRYQQNSGVALTLQGELCGPGIQSNFEGLEAREFFVYKIYSNGNMELPPHGARSICEVLGLRYIPVADPCTLLPPTVKDCLAAAEGPAVFNGRKGSYREGLVYKSLTRDFSFKVISTQFLLGEKEEDVITETGIIETIE